MVKQFNIADHYDVMAQLDRDVHENAKLSQSEADLALRLATAKLGYQPRSIFAPCFGTGRHFPFWLESGVERIVGVDLSPKCVAKAQRVFDSDSRVELHIADLREWQTDEQFDAVIVLGNSFGDIIDPDLLQGVTKGMVLPLKLGGIFVMDYIGENYLDRCQAGRFSVWQAVLDGQEVTDIRTSQYDAVDKVMAIKINVFNDRVQLVWDGCYQKKILSTEEVQQHFAEFGLLLELVGKAPMLQPDYYASVDGELGMIGESQWWIGTNQ